MANEWEKVELYGANNDGNPRRYTVADGVAVSKGTLMAMSDPRTAAAFVDGNTVCAGVASEGKDANDGATTLALWTDGIFEVVASFATAVGAPITGGDSNKAYTVDGASGAQIIGYCMETAALDETVNMRLQL